MNRLTVQHDQTEACGDGHCHVHHVDETPANPYRVCFECNHAYPTGRALRRDHRAIWRPLAVADLRAPDREGAFGFTRWQAFHKLIAIHVRFLRASRITCCPHCAHDF